MGILSRMRLLFNTEVSSALDQAEDPRHVLDYAYSQQQQLLITLRRGLVDVATAKQQLEHQAKRLEERIPHLDDQARPAVGAAPDDLARAAPPPVGVTKEIERDPPAPKPGAGPKGGKSGAKRIGTQGGAPPSPPPASGPGPASPGGGTRRPAGPRGTAGGGPRPPPSLSLSAG